MKVLIVEDHPIVIAGCRTLFADDPDVSLVETTNSTDGLEAFFSQSPDVAVIDINLPDGTGFDLAKAILKKAPDANILIFTMSDAPVLAAKSMECGANGFISKNDDPAKLKEAINTVAGGGVFLPPEMAQELALMRFGQQGSETLSTRELEIVKLIAGGKSMSEIAAHLGVSYKTVTNDAVALRERLNARTPMELVRIAIEKSLI